MSRHRAGADTARVGVQESISEWWDALPRWVRVLLWPFIALGVLIVWGLVDWIGGIY